MQTTEPAAPVRVQRVDPLVWQQALALADGDARRIQVIDDRTVKVQNQRIR
ncbi:MAG: hypothetical protein ACR2KG_06840 [Nocardioidaceae bacterium]